MTREIRSWRTERPPVEQDRSGALREIARLSDRCTRRGLSCAHRYFRGAWIVVVASAAGVEIKRTIFGSRSKALLEVSRLVVLRWPLEPGAPRGNRNASAARREAKRRATEAELASLLREVEP